MTKFTNRIKPDSTELERYFLSVYTGNLWDALEKIKDWHSPEHIEKEVQMKLLKLQQQALPVVPECVDKWYKFHMNGTFSAVITAYAVDGADKLQEQLNTAKKALTEIVEIIKDDIHECNYGCDNHCELNGSLDMYSVENVQSVINSALAAIGGDDESLDN